MKKTKNVLQKTTNDSPPPQKKKIKKSETLKVSSNEIKSTTSQNPSVKANSKTKDKKTHERNRSFKENSKPKQEALPKKKQSLKTVNHSKFSPENIINKMNKTKKEKTNSPDKTPTPIKISTTSKSFIKMLPKEMKFQEAIEIINEIQSQFAKSYQENKPIEEIKKIIGDNALDLNNYVPLSEDEQKNITEEISKKSELRIQNYKTVFDYIKLSLNEIQSFLESNVNNEEEYELEAEEDSDSDSPPSDSRKNSDNYTKEDTDKLSYRRKSEAINARRPVLRAQHKDEDFTITLKNEVENDKEIIRKTSANYNNNVIINENTIFQKRNSESVTQKNTHFEDADFSERIMLENALVLPPKNSPFNYQNVKDMTRTRSKKFSVFDRNEIPKKKVNIDQKILEENFFDSDEEEEVEKEEANKNKEDEDSIISADSKDSGEKENKIKNYIKKGSLNNINPNKISADIPKETTTTTVTNTKDQEYQPDCLIY